MIAQGEPEVKKPGRFGFEFLRPLLSDMIQEDPAKRPTIDEVVSRFDMIVKGLSSWKLRSRVVSRKDFPFVPHRSIAHWTRRLIFIVKRVPPMPGRK